MKILHTADWHLGLPRSPYINNINIRLQDTLNCLEEMLRAAREEKPDYALVCGDIFDTAEIRQARGHKEVLLARQIILELSKASIKRVSYAVPAQGSNSVMSSMCLQASEGQLNFVRKMCRDVEGY